MENLKKSNIQIIKILITSLCGNVGSSILSFVIGLLILKNTNSVINFGFSQIIGPVIAILLLPILGGIVDKYNKKLIMILSQFLSIFSLLLYVVVINAYGYENLMYTYLLLVCLRISDQFFNASTINLVSKQHIQKLNSLNQLVSSASTIVAPIIAAFLLTKFTLESFVIMEIIIELITLSVILFINFEFSKSENCNDTNNEKIFEMFKEGIKFVKGRNTLIFVMVFSMTVNFIFSAISLGLPFIQIKKLFFSDYMYSMTSAIFPFGMIISAIILSVIPEIKNPIKNITRFVMLLGVYLLIFGSIFLREFSNTFYFISIVVFVLVSSFTANLINIPLSTWLVNNIEQNYQGRVFSLLNTISQLLSPVGIMIYSFLFDNVSVSVIFLLSGISVIVTCIFMPKVFKVDLQSQN
ncbi:MAG: MFS transporter [Parvimonas sp.]|uniref:MFS transporter n=1 Tax=Parvimonas sp. TaxID=1944660 RepID=UPI0025CDCB1C|nr:MFS transporter [Parvimonas sp.]MCI5997155.1 MFS transporter [Parvimonas sp.]